MRKKINERMGGRGGAARGSGVSHIPGLMHEAIDSRLLPARCLHFKEEWRQAGELEGAQEQGMKDRRREGRAALKC